ncbi:MAG TPA: NAD+ synthase [Thermoleophilaceae bacterium]|nr:NAD+ synthase [Thermoleophilaceae bacterium]
MAATPEPLRAALAQINPVVGDIEGNAAKVADWIARAREGGAALVVFPELCLTGYPAEDLLLKTQFVDAAAAAVEDIASEAREIAAFVGFPERADDVYNCAGLLADGRVSAVYRKVHLPNYGVFDEQRYFQAGTEAAIVELNGVPIGVTVCEDIWEPGPPASAEALAGAQLIVNLSASPFHMGKGMERERMLVQRARDNVAAVLFCNTVGGQDELVFDGYSVAIDQDGEVIARAPQFEESLTFLTVDPGAVAAARLRDPRHRTAARRERKAVPVLASLSVETEPAEPVGGDVAQTLGPEAEVYAALRLGLRDYVQKNGFERVVIALSGGIDSALTALIAVDALGPEQVVCVSMPSPHSSEGTRADARAIAENLGAECLELPIDDAMQSYERLLAEPFEGTESDVAEENVQARIRGNVVMALSNKFGWLVLATGNKSEMSVGYATLYGDMAGGFAVLKDVFKGWVYRLVRWRNEQEGRELVPASVLDRAPSAELAADQRDEDSLPPYELLDRILAGYVEQDLDAAELVSQGLPAEEVEQVIRMVDRAEYKRRQAPPGIRISVKAFGRDRRLPITNRYVSRVPAERPSSPA